MRLRLTRIGNDKTVVFAMEEVSKYLRMIKPDLFIDEFVCKTYEEYLQMAESAWNITYTPLARLSGAEVSKAMNSLAPALLNILGSARYDSHALFSPGAGPREA